VYNIAYNHFFATFIKPGGPSDLKVILYSKDIFIIEDRVSQEGTEVERSKEVDWS
jgi:hypothetical protein